ncbi:hypothetical protein Vafri_20587, partial [Volvox africanus]
GRHAPQPSTPHTHPGRVGTSGGVHSPSLFGRGSGNGGGGGGTPAGRKPTYGKDNPPVVLYGLANQYLLIELEKDGVWKVSVPDGQRFGKHFLAGLETWARQVLGGEQPMLFKAVAVPVARATTAATTTVTVAATATVTAAATASAFTNRSTPRNFIPPPPSAARSSAGGGGGGSAAGGSANTNTSASATAKRPHPLVSLTGCGLPGLDTIEGAAAAAGQPAAAAAAAGRTATTSGVTRAGGGGATLPLAGGGGPLDFVSLLQNQVGITATTTTGGMSQDVLLPAALPATLLEDKYTSVSRKTQPKWEQQVGQYGEEHQHQQLQGQYRGGGLVAHPVTEYRGLLASSSSMEESDLDFDLDLEGEEGEEREVQQEGVEEESDYGDLFGDDEDDYDGELEVQEDEEDGEDSEREYYDGDEEEEDFDVEEESGSSTTGLDIYDSDLDDIVVAPSTSTARIPPPPPPRMQLSPPSTAAVATAGPAPPPLQPCAPPWAPLGAVVSSPPLTLELMRQCRSLDSLGRLRISLRLERQLLNDTEVEMLAAWYEERAASLIEFSKLWLFDNRIGDRGAAAVARALLHPGVLELHLSHNVIGDKGAAALLEALPVERPTGMRPLWLRLEWNIINADLLQQRLDEQRKARGLISDVPQVRPSSGAPSGSSPAHENRLVLGRLGTPGGGGINAAAEVSVRLPWASCQKQPPSEAGVLRAVKGFYTHDIKPQSSAEPAAAITTQPPPASPPPPPPLSQRLAPPSGPPTLPQPPPPPPATTPSARSTTAAAYPTYAAAAAAAGGDATYASGPLLLFPDTSALISMLGGNTTLLDAAAAAASGSGASPPLSAAGAAGMNKAFPARSGGGGGNAGLRPTLDWSLLVSLAAQGRFGRSLPLPDQVFIVVTDSVMKQLDGLKSLPETRAAVRRFMSEGLELAGPAGYDFLTVLGAHEGEGLALAGEHGGLMGLAGSRSPWLATRGQAVDVRIVEVALYYQAEVTRAYQQSGKEAADGGPGAGAPSSPGGSFLPVILLSNDNAQISAAKSHGLPAFRLTAAAELSVQLDDIARGGGALSSGVLRQLLAPQATKALGTTATRSLQDQFDCAVGTLRGVVAALTGLVVPLKRISQLAAAAGVEPEAEAEAEGCSDGAGELGRAEDALRAALREIR